jgi:hypothetical protein
MITSECNALQLGHELIELRFPSGFSTDLSKSKKTSAAKVTFSVTGFGAGAGAGAGAGGRRGGLRRRRSARRAGQRRVTLAVRERGCPYPVRQHRLNGSFTMPLR